MRSSLKERKFIFLPTFSLPSSWSLLKVPTILGGQRHINSLDIATGHLLSPVADTFPCKILSFSDNPDCHVPFCLVSRWIRWNSFSGCNIIYCRVTLGLNSRSTFAPNVNWRFSWQSNINHWHQRCKSPDETQIFASSYESNEVSVKLRSSPQGAHRPKILNSPV